MRAAGCIAIFAFIVGLLLPIDSFAAEGRYERYKNEGNDWAGKHYSRCIAPNGSVNEWTCRMPGEDIRGKRGKRTPARYYWVQCLTEKNQRNSPIAFNTVKNYGDGRCLKGSNNGQINSNYYCYNPNRNHFGFDAVVKCQRWAKY